MHPFLHPKFYLSIRTDWQEPKHCFYFLFLLLSFKDINIDWLAFIVSIKLLASRILACHFLHDDMYIFVENLLNGTTVSLGPKQLFLMEFVEPIWFYFQSHFYIYCTYRVGNNFH